MRSHSFTATAEHQRSESCACTLDQQVDTRVRDGSVGRGERHLLANDRREVRGELQREGFEIALLWRH